MILVIIINYSYYKYIDRRDYKIYIYSWYISYLALKKVFLCTGTCLIKISLRDILGLLQKRHILRIVNFEIFVKFVEIWIMY